MMLTPSRTTHANVSLKLMVADSSAVVPLQIALPLIEFRLLGIAWRDRLIAYISRCPMVQQPH